MDKLEIYKYQAKQIENTLRMVANVLESRTKKTSFDRDVMQSIGMITNVIEKQIDTYVERN